MKIINNDIWELESHILTCSDTRWIYDLRDKIENESWDYLNNKYDTKDDTVYINIYVKYLNNLNEEGLLELLYFAKKLYIENFWEKHWNIAFSCFSWSLMEDWENYSNIMNNSKIINEYLFNEFNNIYKYYAKNHKYEIWTYILLASRNLGIDLWYKEGLDIYDFWEDYEPRIKLWNNKSWHYKPDFNDTVWKNKVIKYFKDNFWIDLNNYEFKNEK